MKAIFMAALVDSATLREWVTNIGQRSGAQRIAHLFCEVHARMQAVGMATAALPITQVGLSDAVGLSTVYTNRSLQSLREQGLVTFKSGQLVILDPSRLKTMCGFTPNYLHLS